jgi:hypothetical protein
MTGNTESSGHARHVVMHARGGGTHLPKRSPRQSMFFAELHEMCAGGDRSFLGCRVACGLATVLCRIQQEPSRRKIQRRLTRHRGCANVATWSDRADESEQFTDLAMADRYESPPNLKIQTLIPGKSSQAVLQLINSRLIACNSNAD